MPMTSQDYATKEIEIDLQKYGSVLKRRWLIVVTICGLTTALGAIAGNARESLYEAQAKLLFESSNRVSSLVGLEGGTRELKALASQDNPLDTQVEVFQSIPIATQVIEQLNIQDSEGGLIEPDDLLENLSVNGIPGTDVLRVTYESPNPELAAAVVNTMMAVFIENDIQANRAAAVAAQDFIDKQLPDSEAKVSDAESALGQFKENNSVVDLTEESSNTVAELSALNNSLTQLKSQLADNRVQTAKIQQKLGLTPQEAYAVGLISESPGVQEVLQELQSVQTELAVTRTRYEESHPEIENIRRRENALDSLLQSRVDLTLGNSSLPLPLDDLQAGDLEQGLISEFLRLDAEGAGLQQRIGELLNAQGTQQARAQVLPGLERQQRELERKLNAAQTTYETLLENFQQAQVLENQDVGNVRIVSPALVPEKSVLPSTKLYLLAGGIVGALLGVVIAFLSDLFDRSVKTVREGQSLYGYPLLGVLPAWQKRNAASGQDFEIPRILVGEPHKLPIVESYQALQANLKFSYLDKPLKTIAVTSAVQGEGKSEVAANLALTLANLGHLVLVIDANMRDPVQHHVWDVSQMQGLSNFVAGQLSFEDAMVAKNQKLHVLPAGAIPPNPLAILESKQMIFLLDSCKQTYDYIIIDTPALLGLADTLTLGRISDGVLIVMQPGKVDATSIETTRSMLDQSQQRVLGLVANGVDAKSKLNRYLYHHQEYVVDPDHSNAAALSGTEEKSVKINGRS